MEKESKKLTKSTIILLIIIGILLAAVVTLGVLLAQEKAKAPIPGSEIVSQEPEEPPVEEQAALLDAKYITLGFPKDLEGQMDVAVRDTETGVALVFDSKVSEQELELFTILMTKETAAGYLLGTLNHEEAGSLNVIMQMNEQNPEDWTEDAYGQICALQERVNDFIIQFHEDPRFTPNR